MPPKNSAEATGKAIGGAFGRWWESATPTARITAIGAFLAVMGGGGGYMTKTTPADWITWPVKKAVEESFGPRFDSIDRKVTRMEHKQDLIDSRIVKIEIGVSTIADKTGTRKAVRREIQRFENPSNGLFGVIPGNIRMDNHPEAVSQ